MVDIDNRQSWDFRFEGRFLGFSGGKPAKPKYLLLGFSQEKVDIELPKELRASLHSILQLGDRVRVEGRGQVDRATGKLKLTAQRARSVGVDSSDSQTRTMATPSISPQAKILVCQKSKCAKNGGKQLMRSLVIALRDLNLQQQVKIEATGCMKDCSRSPNFTIMPGKHRYGKVRPQRVRALLEEHYIECG